MEVIIEINGISLEIYQLCSSGKWAYSCQLLHLNGEGYQDLGLAIEAAKSHLRRISDETFSCFGSDDLSFLSSKYDYEDLSWLP